VLERTACYLYCDLVADADVTAKFVTSSADSERIVLNGQVVLRAVGVRSFWPDQDVTSMPLKKGLNRLLVRVDNYIGAGGFFGRLEDVNGEPLKSVKVRLSLGQGTPDLFCDRRPFKTWEKLNAEIPPPKPGEHQEFIGAHLARTMALLESGGQTNRPVRIVYYGQSIEFGWVDMLAQRLRERFPKTEIIAENHALCGWGIWALVRAMRHDIVCRKPDLVLVHAYSGSLIIPSGL
jgi:hypothetical protein